ncbi:MAG: hypothetical protein WCQ90_11115, partial [Deltaproteobacteria bacterium]
MTWTEKQTFTITNFLGINFLNDTYLVYGDYPDITTGKTTGVIMQSPRLDMNAYRTTLSSGWNFVSLPVQPDDKTISKMLQDISTNVRIVWGYNNKDKVWLKYKPSAISNTLDIIESGKGYWFYMNNPVTLTVTGKDASPAVALSNGWNLVGYGGQESTMNLPANYVIIWGWENGTWKAKAANTSAQLNVSPLDALNRGKAYWIKMSTDATWQQ